MNEGPIVNPYAPPTRQESFALEVDTSARIHAKLLHRSWTTVTLSLHGDLDAELSYITWTPNESVRLNGKTIAKAKGVYLTAVCPQIDFSLPVGDQQVQATIFARSSYLQLLRLLEFRLVIADRLVYVMQGETAPARTTGD